MVSRRSLDNRASCTIHDTQWGPLVLFGSRSGPAAPLLAVLRPFGSNAAPNSGHLIQFLTHVALSWVITPFLGPNGAQLSDDWVLCWAKTVGQSGTPTGPSLPPKSVPVLAKSLSCRVSVKAHAPRRSRLHIISKSMLNSDAVGCALRRLLSSRTDASARSPTPVCTRGRTASLLKSCVLGPA